jgi:predicted transcriptional regulator
MAQNSRILEMSANIVSSLVRSRPTEPHEVPALMDVVHDGLKRLESGERAVTVRQAISEVESATRSDHLAKASASAPASAGRDAPPAESDLDRDTGFVRDGVVTVTDAHIVCLDDGRNVTFLGRHLKSIGVDPAEYRARRGLPDDYPMTAPGYVAEKRRLAKRQGLGRSVKPSLAARANGARPRRIAGRLSPNY